MPKNIDGDAGPKVQIFFAWENIKKKCTGKESENTNDLGVDVNG